MMPPHQASACHGRAPAGVPSSRPRRVSTTGVMGWFVAKPCSQAGMVWMGTKVLLGYGRNITRKVTPLAASADLVSSPAAAANQEMARMKDSRMPAAGIR